MENPLFKCGRCHHLFRQFPGAPPSGEAGTTSGRRAASAPEPDTLEFIFPRRQPAAIVVADPPPDEVTVVVDADGGRHAQPAAAVAPLLASAARGEATALVLPADERDDPPLDDLTDDLLAEPVDDDAPILGDDDAPTIGDDDAPILGDDDEPMLADDDAPILGAADDDADEDDGPAVAPTIATGRTLRVEDIMKTPAGFGTIMRGIGVAVGAFAALALVVRAAPERAAAWLARMPVAGVQFASDRNLTSKIELKNVQGKFQRLRNSRRVFVISGDARNNSALTIERIEVAGALYGTAGGELDQKIVTTGNRTTLTDLSEAEIALLQRLDPAIALPPGQTTPFLIVFLEPPRELREFSSRVLSVRPTRRASTHPQPPSSRPDSVG